MIAYYCVEDRLSGAVAVRLICDLLKDVYLTELQPNERGFGAIKKRFSNYCKLSEHELVFIFTDLDRVECPPSLLGDWIKGAKLSGPLPSKMCFNIAVTEVEAWLLADHGNLSSYLGVPTHALPNDTQILDPKEFLLNCVQRHGNRRAREELLPTGGAKVGLGYNDHLSRFAMELWDFKDAAHRNASLRRAVDRIAAFG